MKTKQFKSLLSLFLAIIIGLESFSISVFADTLKFDNTNILDSLGSVDEDIDESFEIIGEIESERTEYSKVYLLEDNSFYSITSNYPLHTYEDDSWVDIIDSSEPADTNEAEMQINSINYQNVESVENVNSASSRMVSPSEDVGANYKFLGSEDRSIQGNTKALWIKPEMVLNSTYKNHEKVTISAKINMAVTYYRKAMIGSSATNVKVCEVISDWNDRDGMIFAGFNSDTGLQFNQRILDSVKISSVGNYEWDITDIYSKWERNVSENNGVVITNANSNSTLRIGSFSISRRYRLVSENDNDFSYQCIDMGRAGRVYVNDFTNILRINRDECGIDGNIMPVNISRILDFRSNYNVTNFSGAGARWNYYSYLQMFTSNTYQWFKLDGSTSYFMASNSSLETDDDGRQIWISSDNDCELHIDIISSLNNDFSNNFIEEYDGYKYYFDSFGRVILFEDINNNKCVIHYASNNCIDYIIDGAKRCYVFNYSTSDTNGQYGITSITAYDLSSCDLNNLNFSNLDRTNIIKINNTDYSFNYEYCTIPGNDDGLTCIALSKVIYPDGEFVTYTYDNLGRMTEITNNDNTKLNITYVSDDSNRVAQLVKTKNNAVLQKIEFDSLNTYQRIITLNDTKITLNHYNKNLDLTYVRSTDGTEYYCSYDSNGNITQVAFPENSENYIIDGDFEGNNHYYWTYEGSSTYEYESENNNTKLHITATEAAESMVYQIVELEGDIGDYIALSGKMEADQTMPIFSREICIELYGIDSDGELTESALYSLEFDPTIINEEQYNFGAVKLNDTYVGFAVIIHILNQTREIYFDDIGLYKLSEDSVIDFTQDEETEDLVYCGCDFCQNNNCTCTEDESCACCNIQKVSEADNFGNITKAGTSLSGKELVTTYSYSENGNYIESVINENGVETEVTYNVQNGTLESTKVGNNGTTYYNYNAMGMLTEVMQASSSVENSTESVQYSYQHDILTSITHNGISYNFAYDVYGNCITEQIADNNNNIRGETQYNYDNNYDSKALNSIIYSNGDRIEYTYNEDGLISEIYYNSTTPTFEYNYDSNGVLLSSTDNNTSWVTTYEENGNYNISDIDSNILYSYELSDDGQIIENIFGTTIAKDSSSNYSQTYDCSTGESSLAFDVSYPYGMDLRHSTKYDAFGRIAEKRISESNEYIDPYVEFTISKEYNDTDSKASNQIASITSSYDYIPGNGFRYYGVEDNYEYDTSGRLSEINRTQNLHLDESSRYSQQISYEYDANGQIIRENNQEIYKTYIYNYGSYGNITSVETYDYSEDYIVGTPQLTETYLYDSYYGDLLASKDGNNIVYDSIGNPLSIGNDYELEWNGKQLISYKCPAPRTYNCNYLKIEFEYDPDGNRTKKTTYKINVSSDGEETLTLLVTRYYVWSEGNLIGQQSVNADGTIGNTIRYLYDTDNEPYGFIMNEHRIYLYIKDVLGNVIEIYSPQTRNYIVKYRYDAFGNVSYVRGGSTLAESLGALVIAQENSITYRGYVYDEDSGLYFLHSRYYSPSLRRFLNADSWYGNSDEIYSANLYAYCYNDPVNMIDPEGEEAITIAGITISYAAMFTIIAVTAASMLYLVNPQLQNAVNSAIKQLAFSAAGAISKGISSIIASAKSGLSKPKTSKTNKHHIVAKAASRAASSREYLRKVGIGINDNINLTNINQNFHQYLHKNQYYDAVNAIVKKGYEYKKDRKAGVTASLLIIRAILQEANSLLY